jgi:hypothetical protein
MSNPTEGRTDEELEITESAGAGDLDRAWAEETFRYIVDLSREHHGVSDIRGAAIAALKTLENERQREKIAQTVEAADMGTSDGLGAEPEGACNYVSEQMLDAAHLAFLQARPPAPGWSVVKETRLRLKAAIEAARWRNDIDMAQDAKDASDSYLTALLAIAQATEGSAADLAQVVYAQLDKLGVPYDSH